MHGPTLLWHADIWGIVGLFRLIQRIVIAIVLIHKHKRLNILHQGGLTYASVY